MDRDEDGELIGMYGRMYGGMIDILYTFCFHVGIYSRYKILGSCCKSHVKMTAALKGVSSRGLAASDSWRLTIPR